MPGDCPAFAVPGGRFACGKHSAPSRTRFRWRTKRVRFPTGTVFAFRPECCSGSQRNGVRLHTGTAFTFDRIPQSSKVQVLAPSIACIRTARISGACGGNEARSARTYKPRPPYGITVAVGATWEANKLAGLNITECLQPRNRSHEKLQRGQKQEADPTSPRGRPMTSEKVTGACTRWDRRVGDQASKERLTE